MMRLRGYGWVVAGSLALSCGVAGDVPRDEGQEQLEGAPPELVSAGARGVVDGLRGRFVVRQVAFEVELAVDAEATARASSARRGLMAGSWSPLLDVSSVARFAHDGGVLRPVMVGGAAAGVKHRARVALPERAEAAFEVADERSGVAVAVTLWDALPAPAEVVDGFVVYRGAHESGADVVQRATPTGTEDYLVFEAAPAAAEVRYTVALGDDVAGLRLVDNTLEVIDAEGTPRLRVAPPFLIDEGGTRHDAALSVEDCAVDTDPRAPFERLATDPGQSECTLRVAWDSDAVAYPAVLDPSWSTTGSLAAARFYHSASRLTNNRVLVAGGTTSAGTYLSSSEIYNPATDTWASAAAMPSARGQHGASVLQNGRVLVSGGYNGTVNLAACALYDSANGLWTTAGSLATVRSLHTTTVLASGLVLAAGGAPGPLASSETYNATTNTWTMTTGGMGTGRFEHQATLLPSGNVLVSGGFGGATSITSAEIFSPTTNTWTAAANMNTARRSHSAVVLVSGSLSGHVFVAGGRSLSAEASSESFNPTSGTWTTRATMATARRLHTGTLLADGTVLVAGGLTNSAATATAELFDPATLTWITTDSMVSARSIHTATRLADDEVLVAGGSNSSALSSAELFNALADDGVPCAGNGECTSGFCVDGVCCDTACAGGNGDCLACNEMGSVGVCATIVDTAHVCRAGSGDSCDPDETCNGASTSCPADTVTAQNMVCRAGSGDACDPAEVCSGIAGDPCPTDAFEPTNTVCRTGSGDVCDPDEMCPGVAGGACPADAIAATNVVCRSGSGDVCDPDETCSGVAGAMCPGDVVLPANTECRAGSGDLCNPAEACTGTPGVACPVDSFLPNTVVCRVGSGDSCNPDEMCPGVAAGCPIDVVSSDGDACTDGTFCNGAESCTGGVCGSSAGDPCVANVGDADVDCSESCDEAAAACTANDPAGSSCTDGFSTGMCNTFGLCLFGSADACTSDIQCVSGHCVDGVCCDTACNGTCESCKLAGSPGVCTLIGAGADPDSECANGACDGGGNCDGELGSHCDDGTECLNGLCVDGVCCDSVCDGACEICNRPGANGLCAPAQSGTTCREASGECDAVEACDGSARECPDDAAVADGSSCADGICEAGSCVDDSGAGGTSGTPNAPTPDATSGCGCAVAGAPAPTRAWVALLGVALVVARRRRALSARRRGVR